VTLGPSISVRLSFDSGGTLGANTSNAEAKLILVCQSDGFEKFFEEMGNEMAKVSEAAAQQKMKEVMAKYGMELLGPPLLKALRPGH
jgi:hypothetical protein